MNKPTSILVKILIVLIGFGLISGFIYAMEILEKNVAAEVELKQLDIQNKNAFFQKQTRVIITEVMSSNSYTLLDGFGASSDWIEFYNSSDEVINLKGAGLSTNIDVPMAWVFPDFEIAPKENKVIFASGLDEVDGSGNLHTNFKLNSTLGETLCFTSALGTLISKIEIPPLPSDISYGLNDKGEWLYYNHPTPNAKNHEDGQTNPEFKIHLDSPLKITEYMIDNRSVLYDEDGDFVDWVEFYNDSDAPFPLASLYFSDDPTDPRKWAFPEVVIAPRSYLIVYASRKDKTTQNLHTNFNLTAGETLVVSTQYREILVEQTIDPLLEDYSRGIKDGGWYYFSEPTPGKENSTFGIEEMPKSSAKIPDVTINEVMTSNGSFLAAPDGNFYDWIELKNNTNQDINLKGYTLRKGSPEETPYTFADLLLPAGGFAVFFANAEAATDGMGDFLPFCLGGSGEKLYLCDADCHKSQVFESGFIERNLSSGLNENGVRVFFNIPTPGEANSTDYEMSYSSPVDFSLNGGEISSGQPLTLTAQGGAKIHYTLDGSAPTPTSALYENPIVIDSSRTVKAIAVADGQLPSVITTRTYIVDTAHELPIFALSVDPAKLAELKNNGSNPWSNTETPVHVEFYETDGSLALSFDAGVNTFKGYSKKDPQPSFTVRLRKDYGIDSVTYPLFDPNEGTSIRQFQLVSPSPDSSLARIMDAFNQRAVKDSIDIEVVDSRPCVVYINGEYWGLYALRERVNTDYLAGHQGIDPAKVDLLMKNGAAQAGSNEAYANLLNFVAVNDMRDPANYEYVSTLVDIPNLIDYLILQDYFGITDSESVRFWRDWNGGQWRWVLNDMDWTGLSTTYTANTLSQIFNPAGMVARDWIDTSLYVNLLKNDVFRAQFITRYAITINTVLNSERLLPIFDAMVAEIESESPRQLQRWSKPAGYPAREDLLTTMRQMLLEKPAIAKENLRVFFNLSDAEIQVLFP